MRNRRPRRAKSEINVVPYIDVMLVLLVIFMVAAPMMQPSVINLPSVGKSNIEVAAKPLTVEISAEGAFGLLDAPGSKAEAQANVAALVAAIKAKMGAETERPVIISADKNVKYEVVVQTMDELQRANIARVGLMVQPK
ncbi:protein TolR [Chitinibacter fontanus]|uniref:Protein TolR n=1 Tax=Chitinibacter fontanus TaxID=1737446 RepID=A0A7D5VAK0_9NEIS|nr:protein TolR [Chitinibacter fontanus]QLI81513.1 protein TolR [Chitinibacter fontanus]